LLTRLHNFGYTSFHGHLDHKTAQDLAQPPPIAWREKQMIVEETPVSGSGPLAYSGCGRRMQPARGDARRYLALALRIPCKAPSGAFAFLGGTGLSR
jgi:hypothetical protein